MADTRVIDLVGNFDVEQNNKGGGNWHEVVCRHCQVGTRFPTISYTIEWAIDHLTDEHPEIDQESKTK